MKRKIILIVISAAVVFSAYKLIPHYIKRGIRQTLFSELKPVNLTNCTLKRFGEVNDGGYLMCENLLEKVQSAYSYGIAGNDAWGCAVSQNYHVPVHQYDCFDTTRPVCAGGEFVFHEECIGVTSTTVENKPFDTLTNQILKNNDRDKTLVIKMDVEGAEWNSLMVTPDEILNRIEQLVVEFHKVEDRKYIPVIQKLKKIFYIAHVHFNNFSCLENKSPFPAWAFEVLFVNKRIGTIDETGSKPLVPHPLDAPNTPERKDCQAVW